MSEQIQCCLKYVGKGLEIDTVRLVSLSAGEWEELREWACPRMGAVPLMARLLSGTIPILLSRDELKHLNEEIQRAELGEPDAPPEAYDLLTGFLEQAEDQREASVVFEVWPGRHFDGHVWVFPGTDILADLEEMSSEDNLPS